MPNISDLPEPTTRQFTPYVNGAPPSRVLIGRQFLVKSYSPIKNSKHQIQYDYVRALIEQVECTELPFREIIVSWSTLSMVVTALRSRVSDRAAMECLEEVDSKDIFNIAYPDQAIYQNTLTDFQDRDGDKPNMYELVDYLLMIDDNIEFILTWDSDFKRFDGINLLPNGYW